MNDSTTLIVDGMTCDHCVTAVREALAEVPGVYEVVDVQLQSGRAIVRGSAAPETLIEAIVRAGYQAREA